MKHFNLFNIISQNQKIDPVQLDYLKYELDQRVYSYGDQFLSPRERTIKSRSFNKLARKLAFRLHGYYKILSTQNFSPSMTKRIVSNAYFSINDEFRQIGFSVFSPPWGYSKKSSFIPDIKLLKSFFKLESILETSSFIDLLNKKTSVALNLFVENSKEAYQHINAAALIVPNDINIWERIAIEQFKKMGLPTFTFLHGLPGRYNHLDESRTDYLVVWGEKIKDSYIKAGHDPKRIFISGHPHYKNLITKDTEHSLDNILVITKSMNGAQHSANVVLSDRGNLVAYLYSIQQVLVSLGVKKVRLRPHPSESINWYYRFIDKDFFSFDRENLAESIRTSTLVIGPTSTVMLESLYHGVNYQVYEPSVEGICVDNYPAVPPFDGSDSRVPVAKNKEDLKYFLKGKSRIDLKFWSDYIQTPFDLSFCRELI